MMEMFAMFVATLVPWVGVKFLRDEGDVGEGQGRWLPNFLFRPVFLSLLQMLVDQITERSLELVFMV
jgi:hypothetical protein